MISAIRSNMPSFKDVEFGPGFNVVLADRTKESTDRDSRNGIGKTTLIEIIHFCLGSNTRPNQGLRVEPLKGWAFTLDIHIGDRHLQVTRGVDTPSKIEIQGDTDDLPVPDRRRNGGLVLPANEWNSALGELMFGFTRTETSSKYQPTFRSLISYFV
jgi:uncharacterized protein YydD (DUF2326 family)